MQATTKKASFFAAIILAVTTVAAPLIAAAQSDDFALGNMVIKQEFAEEEQRPETHVLAASTDQESEEKPETSAAPEPVIAEVTQGDSLSKIANAHNTTWQRLFDANESIADPNVINPGDKIRIPLPDEVLPSRAVPAPKPAPAPVAKRTQPKQVTASAARMANDGSVWYQLALCESGGRPNVVSANGKYHGLYQFLPSTWRAVGGSGLPSEASAEEQTMRAQMLQARSGWGQWPACARKLGLL